MYLCMYQPIYLSHSLSLPFLIFFQSLHLFPCLPLFSSIYVSFSLSFPSFPNSLSSSLCLYLFLFLSLMLSLFCFSGDAMDWIARPMSSIASDRMTPIRAKSHPWLESIKISNKLRIGLL